MSIERDGRGDDKLLPLDFKEKNVVVFGGTSGINLGIALAFAKRGAKVTVASRDAERIRVATGALKSVCADALGLRADVRDAHSIMEVFSTVVKHHGAVDILVSGAAGNFLCSAQNMSPNGFKVVVDIDLLGTFNVLQCGLKYLRQPGGVILNISAPQGAVPMRFQSHSGAAKAGVDQLTRVLALEWAELGVRVNAISPGPIEGTEGVHRLMASTDAARTIALQNVPLKRFGTTSDIANLALFLCSEYATYISGALIPCDGGGAMDSVRTALERAGRESGLQDQATAVLG